MSLRIGVVSDSHLTPAVVESESYFPHYIATLPLAERQQFFDQLCNVTRHAFIRCLEGVREDHPDFNVHTGDVTGGYAEQGTLHETIQEGAWARTQMEEITETHVCWGNHDTGYGRRGTLAAATITREGVEGCLEAYGQPMWKRVDGDVLSLGIASPLEEYDGEDPKLWSMKREQQTFIGDTLQQHHGNPWLLFTHDPLAIDSLHRLFQPHVWNNKGMIYGDLHMPIGETFLGVKKYFAGLHPTTHMLINQSALCPSTAPFGWRGYSYLSAEYNENGLMVERKKASREGMPPNPAASAFKGAWMLIHSRIHSTSKE